MNNPSISLDSVMRTLGQGTCTVYQLWLDHGTLWQALGWDESQVKLWLGCLPNVNTCVADSGQKTYRVEVGHQGDGQSLADHIVALLEKAGRPLPMVQMLGKLPAGVVVSEPMLRAAVNADARLELKGPLVKLA